jgi:hypothetical protein
VTGTGKRVPGIVALLVMSATGAFAAVFSHARNIGVQIAIGFGTDVVVAVLIVLAYAGLRARRRRDVNGG